MRSSNIRQGILFVVSAPSGAGKTSLLKALREREPDLSLSVSCTTRTPREAEQDGIHYHFLDRESFEAEIAAGSFLEYAEVFGNLYGTREVDVRALLDSGRDLILEIDWQGARQVRERFVDLAGIFVLPPSVEELERRLRGRGTDSDAVVTGRLAQAVDDMSHFGEYDYCVVNAHFETALDELASIVVAERLRTARLGGLIDGLIQGKAV